MARKRGSRWQGDARLGGKRLRKTFATEQEALAWETQMMAADENGLTPTQVEAEGTLRGFIAAHFERLWGDKKSVSHMRLMADVVQRELGPSTTLRELTERRISAFVSDLKRQGNANGTINRKLSFLSKLLKYAHRLQMIARVPHIDKLSEGQGRTSFLSRDEEDAARYTLNQWGLAETRQVFDFLLYTGARRGEALALTWRDVVLDTKERPTATFWETKGGSPRTVPLVGRALEAVRERPRGAPTDRVFPV